MKTKTGRMWTLALATALAAGMGTAAVAQPGDQDKAKTATSHATASHDADSAHDAKGKMSGAHGKAGHGMAGHSAGSMELHKAMMSGRKMPMPMSGDVDRDFATMMTMHHEQAIRMSDVLLKQGKSAQLKALAMKMKAAQQDEIRQLAPYTK